MREAFSFGKNFAVILVRQLNQNTGAVAHQLIGTDRAAMGEILQNEQALGNNRVTFMALNMGDKTDAAGIMLVGAVVQAVLLDVLDFGFDAGLVLHSELLMDIAGIKPQQDGAFIHSGGGRQGIWFGVHWIH
jgi:hypothetical protein